MPQKGHLGVGADADVTIYNENPDGVMMFRYPRYVIKAGEIAVEEGQIRNMREAGNSPSARVRPEDRGLPAPRVPAVLHDVVRQLPVEADRVHGLQVHECTPQP